jgi:hypothetical protein
MVGKQCIRFSDANFDNVLPESLSRNGPPKMSFEGLLILLFINYVDIHVIINKINILDEVRKIPSKIGMVRENTNQCDNWSSIFIDIRIHNLVSGLAKQKCKAIASDAMILRKFP